MKYEAELALEKMSPEERHKYELLQSDEDEPIDRDDDASSPTEDRIPYGSDKL